MNIQWCVLACDGLRLSSQYEPVRETAFLFWLTGRTQRSSITTARCWRVTTSAQRTASCRTTTRWTSSTTCPRTTGGQRVLEPMKELRGSRRDRKMTVPHTAQGSCLSTSLFSLLPFHPESCGLWWWRWCWLQTCPVISSRWRSWRTSYNNRRGQLSSPPPPPPLLCPLPGPHPSTLNLH